MRLALFLLFLALSTTAHARGAFSFCGAYLSELKDNDILEIYQRMLVSEVATRLPHDAFLRMVEKGDPFLLEGMTTTAEVEIDKLLKILKAKVGDNLVLRVRLLEFLEKKVGAHAEQKQVARVAAEVIKNDDKVVHVIIEKHHDSISSFVAVGDEFLSIDREHRVIRWKAKDQKMISDVAVQREVGGVYSQLRVSKDGKKFFRMNFRDGVLEFGELSDVSKISKIKIQTQHLNKEPTEISLDVNTPDPDDSSLQKTLFLNESETVLFVKIKGEDESGIHQDQIQAIDLATGKIKFTLFHEFNVEKIHALSQDRLLVVEAGDQVMKIYDAYGKVIKQYNGLFSEVAVSPDHKSFVVWNRRDYDMYLYNEKFKKSVVDLSGMKSKGHDIGAMSISHDGHFLAIGSGFEVNRGSIIDLRTRKFLMTYGNAHESGANVISFTEDGQYIVGDHGQGKFLVTGIENFE